ncbi:MAG: hypothetical protein ABEK01_02450 [Candidatus Nanohaloarchaea archaeon]
MRKLLAGVVLFSLMLSPAASQLDRVFHQVSSTPDRMWINTTLRYDCSGNCNYRQSWIVPENATVYRVEDANGEINGYTVIGSRIKFPVNTETARISFLLRRDAERIYGDLYRRQVSLPSIRDVRTSGTVTSENLLSGWTSFGFNQSFSGNRMEFEGRGPLVVRFKFGEGNETEYFEFFGSHPDRTEIAYEVPVGTLGLRQGFRRFPVASMPGGEYNRSLPSWSAGEYVAGVIRIRAGLGDRYLPVLAHEVAHGLNDREFRWDATETSYLDEGISKYIGFLVHKKLYGEGRIDRPPRELFGDRVKFDPHPSTPEYYTIPSKGDRDVLWNYYSKDREFMKNWSPMSSEYRRFGYAYSELIVRNYIARMNGSLRQFYQRLRVGKEVKDPDVKWNILSHHMDLTPCKYGSREKFNRCLDRINSYDYPVYSAENVQWTGSSLNVTELEVPDRNSSVHERRNLNTSFPSINIRNSQGILRAFLDTVSQILEAFLGFLRSLF